MRQLLSLDNLNIKNPFLLSPINKILDWLSWAYQFTQLNPINIYNQIIIQEDNRWKTIFYTRYNYVLYYIMFF